MAIQIRRGTNTEWESNNSNIVVGEPAIATDAERFFVGTASGDYAEFANLDIIAPAHDTSTSYVVGDVINRQGKLYSCNAPCSGAFNVSYWDEKSLAEILKDLENDINYAQYEIGYASGELITIDNGASEIPVKDLTLDIEAVQDLHGYDNPWVGGAGKNIANFVGNVYSTGSGLTITSNSNGSISFTGTATQTYAYLTSAFTCNIASGTTITLSRVTARPYRVYIHVTYSDSTSGDIIIEDNTTSITTTLSKNVTTIQLICSHLSTSTAYNETVYPMLEIGSAQTSFEPYENICPISGWDEVNVCVAGKNLFFMENWNLINGYFTLENGIRKIIANVSHYIYYFPCEPNTTYTVSKISDGSNIRLGLAYSVEKPAIDSVLDNFSTNNGVKTSGTVVSATITTSATAKYLSVWAYWVTDEATKSTIQLEKGDERTEFVPFANIYTTDLNGTRYGGTLDVTTGVLTITHEIVDLGNLTWIKQTNASWNCFSSSITGKKNGGTVICSNYPQGAIYGTTTDKIVGVNANSNNIYVRDSSYMSGDASAFKTAMNGVQLVYELATPQVVQLTPTQVRTVLGTNNLWNQMNSNNELAYRISNALN